VVVVVRIRMNKRIREYIEDDVDGILNLFMCSFNKEASKDWFRWKYQCSPWGSKGYVAMDGNRVVAFYGGIRLQFSFAGRTLWAYQFCDVMTHPKYRGRLVSKTPLIALLCELFYRENPMDFAFGFPSLRHARLQSLRLGGEGYRPVRLYKKEDPRGRFMPWGLKIEEGWKFLDAEKLNRFINRNRDTLLLVKNESYIKWRYVENPSKKYRLFVLKRLQMTKGHIIFTLEDSWLNILEIFYKGKKDIEDLLISLEAYVAKNMDNIRGIRAWFHPKEPEVKYLETLGYKGEDYIPIAFKSVNKGCGINSEVFYERYFYRMGDYDAS